MSNHIHSEVHHSIPYSDFILLSDLRIHDNPLIHAQWSSEFKEHQITHFLPIYVFDQRIFNLKAVPGFADVKAPKTPVMKLHKTGLLRTK